MKTTAKIELCNPTAMGNVLIEYTDAITGRVKEQIKGKNHCFSSELFVGDWRPRLASAPLFLMDGDLDTDINIPYLSGKPIGVGIPNSAASGTFRGNYVGAASYLAKLTDTGLSWKYKYEFSASQVLSPVKSLGLTLQYDTGPGISNPRCAGVANISVTSGYAYALSDGAQLYVPYSTGIIKCMQPVSGIVTDIDKSSVLGSTGEKRMGLDPSTGYFFVVNMTTKMCYVFSDNTFTTLVTTYNVSNIFGMSQSFGVYNNVIYHCGNSGAGGTLQRFNVATNTVLTNFTYTTTPFNEYMGSSYNYLSGTNIIVVPGYNFFILAGSSSTNTPWTYHTGIIFDMSNETIYATGYFGVDDALGNTATRGVVPWQNKLLLYNERTSQYMRSRPAFTRYKLPVDAPARPAGSGMSVTYELEVAF